MTTPARPESSFGLKTKTWFALGFTLFAGFLIASAVSFVIFRNSIRESILRNELPLSSDNIYSEIQRDLFEPILISSLMANDTFLRDWIVAGERDDTAVTRYLQRIQEQYGTITAFFVSESTRNYYHSTAPTRPVREGVENDAWFFRVRAMDPMYEINIDPDLANRNTMTIFINYRVLDKQGEFLGATGVGLSVTAVKSLINDYHRRYHRDVFFYNREGQLVLHRLDKDADQQALLAHRELGDTLPLILERLNAGEKEIDVSGESRTGALANFRYIPELDWILVVEQSSDGTRPALLRSFALNMLICLVTSVILLLFIYRTSLRYHESLESRNRQLLEQHARIEEQAHELERANQQLVVTRQAAEAASRAKSSFIANMSHEIRTPMNAIIGFSDVLCESLTDPAEREKAQIIASSGRSLLTLVSDILDISKIEAGRLELRPAPLHLESLLEEVRLSFSQLAADKGLNLRLETSPDLPSYLLLDETRLRQILINLVGNAIKFTRAGDVCLQAVVLTQTADPARVSLEIRVSDTGIGIPEHERDRIFETFEQGQAATDGTGLGLTISQRLATLLGGSISVRNHPSGQGSVFVLQLSAPVATSSAPQPSPAPAVTPGGAVATAAVAAHPTGLQREIDATLRARLDTARRHLRLQDVALLVTELRRAAQAYGAPDLEAVADQIEKAARAFRIADLNQILTRLLTRWDATDPDRRP